MNTTTIYRSVPVTRGAFKEIAPEPAPRAKITQTRLSVAEAQEAYSAVLTKWLGLVARHKRGECTQREVEVADDAVTIVEEHYAAALRQERQSFAARMQLTLFQR